MYVCIDGCTYVRTYGPLERKAILTIRNVTRKEVIPNGWSILLPLYLLMPCSKQPMGFFVRTGVNSYFLVFTFTLPSSKFQVPTSSSSSSALSFALFVFSEPFVSRLATRLVLFVPSCSLSESVMPRLHISVEPHTLQLFVIQ